MPSVGDHGWVSLPADLRPASAAREWFEDFPALKIKENSNGTWVFKTKETYENSTRPGVLLNLLARGSQFESRGLHRLRELTPITNSTSAEQLASFADARRRQVSSRSDDEPLWSRFVGELQISVEGEVEGKLRGFQSEGQSTDSLWIAEVDSLLSKRLAFMRMLFAQRYTRDAIATPDFVGLPAAKALMVHAVSGFTMYFSPILLLDSPWVGGFNVARPYATILRLLTIPEPGRPRGWTDQLDSFKPSYAGSASWPGASAPAQNLETREHVLQWWVARLSELLWMVSDPTRYTDREGSYDPSIHFGVTLTCEKLFVTAVEIMSLKSKDEFMRKMLFFDFLDLQEGHGMGAYEKNLSYDRQHALWVRVKQTLPEPISRCFSPVIEGAFEALLRLDAGFWSAASRTSDNKILINRDDGFGQDAIDLDKARPGYLREMRNSTHGFRGIANKPRRLSYLANHTGEIDNNLPDLVWWYLIRMLTTPVEISH